ncbi:hypothetical protein P692DRAFT_20936159, partial [Suillus brevipes Sb2]
PALKYDETRRKFLRQLNLRVCGVLLSEHTTNEDEVFVKRAAQMADSSLDTLYIHPSANLQARACTWWQLGFPGSVVRMRLRIKRRVCAIGKMLSTLRGSDCAPLQTPPNPSILTSSLGVPYSTIYQLTLSTFH